jgi:hypothetical protein
MGKLKAAPHYGTAGKEIILNQIWNDTPERPIIAEMVRERQYYHEVIMVEGDDAVVWSTILGIRPTKIAYPFGKRLRRNIVNNADISGLATDLHTFLQTQNGRDMDLDRFLTQW